MTRIKLAAGDAEDLQIVSARIQDAVAQLKNVTWLPKTRRFVLLLNRLQWNPEPVIGPAQIQVAALVSELESGTDPAQTLPTAQIFQDAAVCRPRQLRYDPLMSM